MSMEEWMITGRDVHGNRKRFVLHAYRFIDAAHDAVTTANQYWGHGAKIDSIERQGHGRDAEEEAGAFVLPAR